MSQAAGAPTATDTSCHGMRGCCDRWNVVSGGGLTDAGVSVGADALTCDGDATVEAGMLLAVVEGVGGSDASVRRADNESISLTP